MIPTIVRKEPEQPDIVRIKIEGERQIVPAPKPVSTPEPSASAETLPAMQTQRGYPVMEVIIRDVHLRVTNDVSPALLAETIQLLRSAGC